MLDEEDRAPNNKNKPTPLLLLVPPHSPIVGMRDPYTGILIVVGSHIAICPSCGSVQLEESWVAKCGCSNPDCSLFSEQPLQPKEEPTLTYPYSKPATPQAPSPTIPTSDLSTLPPFVEQPTPPQKPPFFSPSESPKPTVATFPPQPQIVPPVTLTTITPHPTSTTPSTPAPTPIISPASPVTPASPHPPPYIAPQMRPKIQTPGLLPTIPIVNQTITLPQPPSSDLPSKPEVILPQQPVLSTPTPTDSKPVSQVPLTQPIMEIPAGWLTPAAEMQELSAVPMPPLTPTSETTAPFAAAAPPPEGSIVPTPITTKEETIQTSSPGAPSAPTSEICIICGNPLLAKDIKRTCGRCGAIHHMECWEMNRGCGRELCGSKITLEQARIKPTPEEETGTEFFTDPYGKPKRRNLGEALKTLLSKKEFLIGLGLVIVVAIIIIILVTSMRQTEPEETKGKVNVTVSSNVNKNGGPTASVETTPDAEATNTETTNYSENHPSTDRSLPPLVTPPKVATQPTTTTAPVFPPLEESDIRQGLAGVQQNASIRYQGMLKKKQDLRGSIIVTFTVRPDGTVTGLIVAKNTMNDASMGSQLESQIKGGIKGIRFRQSPKGKATSFTFSFSP